MKSNFLILITAATLSLTACSQKADTSVPANESTASTASEKTSAKQTLTSSDNKITIITTGTHFTELSKDDANNLPAGVPPEELTLLQRDDDNDISLYATNLGEAKTTADNYFNNLKNAIKSNKALSNIRVGIATENRMNYSFTLHQDNSHLNENCLAIYEGKQLYTICANSNTASQDELANMLSDVIINQ